MIGPPGAGKGTQGALLATHFNIPHIVIGDLLRDHVVRGTQLGRVVQGHLDRGELVPDEIMLDLVRQSGGTIAGGGDTMIATRGGSQNYFFAQNNSIDTIEEAAGAPNTLVTDPNDKIQIV